MRPKRLYKTKRGRYYYLRKGKRVYIKRKKGAPKLSQKQLVKISIKNIIGDTSRRVKRRRKRKKLRYTKKIVDEQRVDERRQVKTGLPVYLFEPKKIVPSLTERVSNKAKKESTTSYDTLLDEIGKLRKLITLPDTEKKTKTPKTIPSIEGKKEPVLELEDEVDIENELVNYIIKKNLSGQPKNKVIDSFIEWEEDENNTFHTPDVKNSLYDDDLWKSVLKKVKSVKGKGKGEGGLYDDEIEKINKKVFDTTIPVIAKNELDQLDQYVKPNMSKFGFIINTDPMPQPKNSNGHWRAVYINNCDDYQSIEYFDPLVSTPEKALIDKLRKIAQKINPEQFFLFKINNLITQPDESDNCGYHCILFLEKRFHNVPWSEATYYNDYMDKTKPDHTTKGEGEVLKAKRKYKTYL